MPWTLDLLSVDGLSVVQAGAKFKSATITWALNDMGSAELNLTPAQVASGNWLHGRRRLRFKDGAGTVKYGGWLDRLERSGKPGDLSYRAASRGLAAILDQRVIHGNVQWNATAWPTIVQNLIAHMVAQTFDKTGFTTGTVFNGPGVVRDRWYCDGAVIGEAVRELAEMANGGGWEISPTGALNIWVGGRGTDLSGTYTIAPTTAAGRTIDWSCTQDVSEMVTYGTAIGDAEDNSPCGPPVVIDFNTLRTDYGRREAVIKEETQSEAELLEKLTEELRARAASGLELKTAWIEGKGPWSFGTVWLGDQVNAALGTEFGGTVKVRCVDVSISLESKHEFVEMTWETA